MSAHAIAPSAERALDRLAGLVLEDGRRWGEAAADFQWEDARGILDPEEPPYSFCTRPRGASKTTDVAAVVLAAMLDQIREHGRVVGVASDRDQARELLGAFEGFVRRTPGLEALFDVGAWRAVCRRTEVALDVIAADAASAFGLRPDLVVADELAVWAETPGAKRLWEAVSSSVVKMVGCRLVVISTSGDPSHWAKRILDHAKTDPLWRVNEVPGPVPWLDPERIEEQRRRLLPSQFARLHLNEWTAGEDRLAFPEDVAACVSLEGPQEARPGAKYVTTVDLGLKHDRSIAAVCHLEDRTVVLDRMEVWAGTRETPVRLETVEDWLREAHRSYGGPVVVDPWQAVGLLQRLRDRGIRVTEYPFTAQSVGRLAVTLYNAIRDHALAIPPDEDLIDELCSVRLRESSPGVVRLDHVEGKHDDRAIALAMAAQHLLERPAKTGVTPTLFGEVNLGLSRSSYWSGGGESDWRGARVL